MLKIKEEWKDISGYEGRYQISNMGRVKSLPRIIKNGIGKCHKKGRILKPQKAVKGYIRVTLCNEQYCKPFKIHRLVAEHFIPNPENKPQVNHINGDKTDNRVENLEWCTNGENQLHAYKLGLKTKKKEVNMKEEKIKISVNQEDVQNIIDCYEEDIEYIKHLEEENKSLQSQLKEKEEVIKEARECIETPRALDNSLAYVTIKSHLLEILSKGENK